MYVPAFESTTSDLTQSAPTGNSNTTTLAVLKTAQIRTGSTQTLTASQNVSETATWTLQYDGQTIGSITITNGQSTGSTTLSTQVLIEPGKNLGIIAPAGTPLVGGTATMTWRVNNREFAEVPRQPNKAFVNQGGVWTAAKEAWVALEVGFLTYEWRRAWRVPEPPAGVKPDLEQFDGGVAVLNGGDVRAFWTNTTTDYSIIVSFEVDTGSGFSVVDSVTRSPGSTDAILDRSFVNNGDQVRARMRYFEGAVQGDFSAYSDTLNYVDL
jgi:hypothetical protein